MDWSHSDTVFKAIVLDKILYALPVYYEYLTEGQQGVLQRVLDRATSRGFTPYYYDLDVLAENARHRCQRGTLPQSAIYRKT